MKRRFILYRRKLGGTFYVEDTQTRKQESLGTKNRAEAVSLLNWTLIAQTAVRSAVIVLLPVVFDDHSCLRQCPQLFPVQALVPE